MNAQIEALRILVAAGVIPLTGEHWRWNEGTLDQAVNIWLNHAMQIQAERAKAQEQPPEVSDGDTG